MDTQRAPLQVSNGPQSRLPGLRKIPVPKSASKLPMAASQVKRSRSSDETLATAAPIKRRKLSDDKPPVAVRKTSTTTKPSGVSTRNVASRPGAVKPRVGMSSTKPKVASSSANAGPKTNAAPPATKKPAGATGGKKARPAWDLKGRLQDMEEQMKAMSSQYQQVKSVNAQGDEQIKLLAADKENIVLEHEGCKKTITDMKTNISEKDDQITTMKRSLDDVEHEKSQLKRHLTSTEDDLSAAQGQIRGLKGSVAEMSAAQEQIRAHNDVLKVNLETANNTIASKNEVISETTGELEKTRELVVSLEEKLRAYETERRQLHNTIQELKGNIRVFCRVRPLLEHEIVVSEDIEHIGLHDDGKTLEIARLQETASNDTLSCNRKGSKFEFKYDRVFSPAASQADVFEEISQLVQSALDGYNVCIFAYGQTGSGKTFTMEGAGQDDPATQGMIPRSVSLIFDFVQTLLDKGWQYTFEASFLEIYNESIRDLLVEENGGQAKKHEIKMVQAQSSEVYVTNLRTVSVTQREEVDKLLKMAAHNRAVAETKCNARSSRSHSVFRLRISGHNTHTDEKCVGMLNLIDLAGSERIKESGSEGARLKEATAINGSLSHLGNVIMALANKDSHVPYRNSKLTHLLQHSLGGSSKVLMFVNVSPREDCVSETLNSLRFATKVNNCHIGTASKKTK